MSLPVGKSIATYQDIGNGCAAGDGALDGRYYNDTLWENCCSRLNTRVPLRNGYF